MFVSFVFVLWCFVCQQWYVCGIKQNCKETTRKNLPATNSKDVAQSPILFQWANEKAITNPTFSVLKDSIINVLSDTSFLEITGFYFKNETADSIDMGLKRAEYIKTLFLDKVPSDKVILRSQILKEVEGIQKKLFESATVKIVESAISTQDHRIETAIKNQELIVKTNDGVLIYFPFNSSKKEMDIKVDGYLQQLSTRLQNSDEKIHIIGHTDNVGDAKVNYNIGRQRAKKIRDILISSGVSRGKITVFSKGETEPIATNETEEGRQKNRRTEIKIFE